MNVNQLQIRLLGYVSSLFQEGFLDDQFNQLQQLQDESNSDFVFEVVSVFFEDAERLLKELGKALEQQHPDYQKLDAHVHQLKGSSSSIGAQRVRNVCIALRNCCEEHNTAESQRCLQLLEHEYSLVKNKFESLFMLQQQILAAGGSLPIWSEL